MSYKMIVSKPGYNAVTETNPDNLIFSSDYETLRYAASGTINLSWTENANPYATFQTSVSLPGGINYRPFIISFVDFRNTGTFRPVPFIRGSVAFYRQLYVWWNATTLFFRANSWGDPNTTTPTARTAVFRYFIFNNNIGL